MDINNNVIDNAYYMINLFERGKKNITHLKLEILMYFTECFFISSFPNFKTLFKEPCYASVYCPTYQTLYERFADFRRYKLVINSNDSFIGETIPKINKTILEQIYMTFSDFSLSDLVCIVLDSDCPYRVITTMVENKNFYNYGENGIIMSKIKSAEWFRKIIKPEGVEKLEQ